MKIEAKATFRGSQPTEHNIHPPTTNSDRNIKEVIIITKKQNLRGRKSNDAKLGKKSFNFINSMPNMPIAHSYPNMEKHFYFLRQLSFLRP
jgi:hypothetical protein